CELVYPPKRYDCDWQSQQGLPPDGDMISFSTECCAPRGTVGLVLQVPDTMTWWKGLRVGDDRVGLIGPGESFPATSELRARPVSWKTNDLSARWLILSKAKYLGAHTDVYGVELAELVPYDGMRVVFRWFQDWGGV